MPPSDSELRLVGSFRQVLRRTTGHITKQIDFAVSVSEQEVLAIGNALMKILRESKKRVDTCKQLLENVDDDSAMARTIAQQYETMHGFVQRMKSNLSEQSRIADEAFEASAQIVEAGERITAIARTAKLLNVNAQVEAARLGDAGRSMGVVADEMTRLSAEIERTNRVISRLATSLAECMPTLTAGAERLENETLTFAESFQGLQQDVHSAQSELTDRMRSLLTESQADAQNAWSHAKEALGHLNYQDPMAQGLRKVTLVTDKLSGQYDAAFRRLLQAAKHRAEALSRQRAEAKAHGADRAEPESSLSKASDDVAISQPTDGVWNGAVPLASNPLANFAQSAAKKTTKGSGDRAPPTETDTFGGGPEGTAGSVVLFDDDPPAPTPVSAPSASNTSNAHAGDVVVFDDPPAEDGTGDGQAGDVLFFDDEPSSAPARKGHVGDVVLFDDDAALASNQPANQSLAPAVAGDVLLFDDDDAAPAASEAAPPAAGDVLLFDEETIPPTGEAPSSDAESDSETEIRDAAAGDVILF